jgi:hypothetical protein
MLFSYLLKNLMIRSLLAALLLLTSLAPAGAARQHRSHRATLAFKRSHPCPATGRKAGSCPGFVIDHIRPLRCGGADDPRNMQWQTVVDAKAKDRWERNCSL